LGINDVLSADPHFLRCIPDVREHQRGGVFRRNGILALAIGRRSGGAALYLDAYARQRLVIIAGYDPGDADGLTLQVVRHYNDQVVIQDLE
jgi:hypothetical protein